LLKTTDDFERLLLKSLNEQDFGPAVDAFLGHLLFTFCGYGFRSTDGVIIEHFRLQTGRAVASGVVVMLRDQTIEPVRVELAVDEPRTMLLAGSLSFGDKTRIVACGSTEDRELRHLIIADPEVQFAWKERLHRGSDGWRRDERVTSIKRSRAIQTVIDAVEARWGAVTLYGSNESEQHGTCFMISGIPATFSVHTSEGSLPADQYDIQIEGVPPGDYVFTAVVSLKEFLVLVGRCAGPDSDWPTGFGV
jgi:hypothetical protein